MLSLERCQAWLSAASAAENQMSWKGSPGPRFKIILNTTNNIILLFFKPLPFRGTSSETRKNFQPRGAPAALAAVEGSGWGVLQPCITCAPKKVARSAQCLGEPASAATTAAVLSQLIERRQNTTTRTGALWRTSFGGAAHPPHKKVSHGGGLAKLLFSRRL